MALVSFPIKKTSDVDMTKRIRAFIADVYVDLRPSDYDSAVVEFNKLRMNVVSKLAERNEAALECLYRYHDQLMAIEGKLPIAENQIRIDFVWQDAFSRKNKTIASAAYEIACVLYSIGTMQARIAENQNMLTDDGLKLAAKLLQQASGVFAHLATTVVSTLSVPPTTDLSPEVLNCLSALTLAEAQECFVRKAIRDNMKPNNVAKLANQCSQLYTDALKLMQLESLKGVWSKDWLVSVSYHQDALLAIAQYHQSLVDRDAKKYGEWLSRLRVSRERMAAAEKASAGSSFAYADFQKTIAAALQEAEKENGMIYHLRVPDPSSLPVIEKATLAKPLPFTNPMSSNFHDLFCNVVPMIVLSAVASFEARKAEIVSREVGRLREATRTLNTLLISYNLPAAIEDLSGENVPHSLLTKAAAVRQAGGIEYLTRLTMDLPLLLQRNKEILDHAERELAEEEANDRQLRAQFGVYWSRTQSEALTAPIRQELVKYRMIIGNALNADALIRQRYATHRNNISLLSLPDTDIERSLPAGGPVSAMQGSSVITTLRRLVDEAQVIKEGRDAIETQLKDVKCDVANQFLTTLMHDGALNEAQLCSQHLDRVYGPLREQVAQSLKRQDNVTKQLQQSYTEFSRAKTQTHTSAAREKQLRDLAMAYDNFMDLKCNIEEGTQFYDELNHMLIKFQAKVGEFCAARRAEKEELLKDLQASGARQPASPTSPIPSFHQSPPMLVPSYQQPAVPASAARSVNTIYVGGGMPSSSMGPPVAHSAQCPTTFFMAPMPSMYNPYAQF